MWWLLLLAATQHVSTLLSISRMLHCCSRRPSVSDHGHVRELHAQHRATGRIGVSTYAILQRLQKQAVSRRFGVQSVSHRTTPKPKPLPKTSQQRRQEVEVGRRC